MLRLERRYDGSDEGLAWENSHAGVAEFLFAPGNHARRVEKALSLDADAVILDLEDAVATAEKRATREAVIAALVRPRRALLYVRVNAVDTEFCYGDLTAVVRPGCGRRGLNAGTATLPRPTPRVKLGSNRDERGPFWQLACGEPALCARRRSSQHRGRFPKVATSMVADPRARPGKHPHDKRALIYVDDAGGARVGPAAFGQPRMLELGIDLGATGLDKYGTSGPRFGLLAGRKDLVGRIRVKGFEFGMEARQMLYPAVVRTLQQYDPARVRALIATTKQIAGELRALLGNRLRETPTTVQIGADDILEIAMERGGVRVPPVVPYEASAALSMLLLRDRGMLMVHFVGVPPGTADLLIKFVPPKTLERFGGARKYAQTINGSLTRLGEMLQKPEAIRELLLGES